LGKLWNTKDEMTSDISVRARVHNTPRRDYVPLIYY